MIPKLVKICEAWARDGLQGERRVIPTEEKIKVIEVENFPLLGKLAALR